MSRWLYSFQAIDPNDPSKKWEVGVEKWLFRTHQKHGNKRALSRLILVREVVEEGTIRIYKGWSRPGKGDCFVFEGKPGHDYKNEAIETPAPPGMVFLVFILPSGAIDEWTWRPLVGNEKKLPEGITGEIIWEQKTT